MNAVVAKRTLSILVHTRFSKASHGPFSTHSNTHQCSTNLQRGIKSCPPSFMSTGRHVTPLLEPAQPAWGLCLGDEETSTLPVHHPTPVRSSWKPCTAFPQPATWLYACHVVAVEFFNVRSCSNVLCSKSLTSEWLFQDSAPWWTSSLDLQTKANKNTIMCLKQVIPRFIVIKCTHVFYGIWTIHQKSRSSQVDSSK